MREKFDKVLIGMLFVALSLVIAVMAYQSIHKQQMIAEAIKAGADPIAVRCAFEGPGSSGSSAECVIAAGKWAVPRQEGAAK